MLSVHPFPLPMHQFCCVYWLNKLPHLLGTRGVCSCGWFWISALLYKVWITLDREQCPAVSLSMPNVWDVVSRSFKDTTTNITPTDFLIILLPPECSTEQFLMRFQCPEMWPIPWFFIKALLLFQSLISVYCLRILCSTDIHNVIPRISGCFLATRIFACLSS
jgi:hypothetical protein